MANPRLTPEQRKTAEKLLIQIRAEIEQLSGGDQELLFAYRRRIMTQLQYDERSKPPQRAALKAKKYKAQNGCCFRCKNALAEGGRGAVLVLLAK